MAGAARLRAQEMARAAAAAQSIINRANTIADSGVNDFPTRLKALQQEIDLLPRVPNYDAARSSAQGALNAAWKNAPITLARNEFFNYIGKVRVDYKTLVSNDAPSSAYDVLIDSLENARTKTLEQNVTPATIQDNYAKLLNEIKTSKALKVTQEAQAEDHPPARHPRLQRRRSRPGLRDQLQSRDQHPRSHCACPALGERPVRRDSGHVEEGAVRLRGRRPQEHVHDVPRGIGKPGEIHP